MKCRAKTTFKQPFKISVDFSSSLGPVALGAFKDIGNSLSGRVDQWHDFTADAASTNEASNQTTIQNASPTVQKKLYDIDNFISLQASSSSRFTDSTEPKQLTIGSSRDL